MSYRRIGNKKVVDERLFLESQPVDVLLDALARIGSKRVDFGASK